MTAGALPPCVLELDGETLSAWRDGLLLVSEAQRIAQHTPGCPSCQRNLGNFETIATLLNAQRAPSLRAEIWDGVRRRIMDGGRSRPLLGGGHVWGSAAAAVAVVTLVGLFAALLARGPLGGAPIKGTPGPTATPCQLAMSLRSPLIQSPTGRISELIASGPTATPDPCAPTPSATPTITPVPVSAYEQLGWTAPPGVKQGKIPRVVFADSQPSVGYACTFGADGAAQISKTTDGGATWKFLSSPIMVTFCILTVNPTNANDVLVNDGGQFGNVTVRSKDGGVTWTKQDTGRLAFDNWGWAGSTLLLTTVQTESPESLTALYKSVNGEPFVQLDQQGQLAGAKLGNATFLGGTASQFYVQSGVVQLSDPVTVNEVTYTSHNGGTTWQKVTFAGGLIHLLSVTADGRAFIGLDSADLTRAEVSLDAGQTWRKLPVKPTGVPGFGAFYVTADGSVIATSQRLGMVENPDNRVFLARPGVAQWSVAAILPQRGYLRWIAADNAGRPTKLWATYGQDDRGELPEILLAHAL
jgi:hypothetical protein